MNQSPHATVSELTHQKACKKNMVITDAATGEIVCRNCGAVSPEKAMDAGCEPGYASGENYPKSPRVGNKTSLMMADMGLSTLIATRDKDVSGRFLSNENRRMFHRLRMWDRNSRFAAFSKSFQKAFVMLDAISSKLGLPELVVEETAYLFRKIHARKVLAGRSTSEMLCGTLYVACRITNTPRTLHDIATAGNIKKKSLQGVYRFLVMELDLHPDVFGPKEFVTRLVKASSMSERAERLAFGILDMSERGNMSTSKNPMSMAAAAVYLASKSSGEKVSQTKISRISGISSMTIRERAKEIEQGMGGETDGKDM